VKDTKRERALKEREREEKKGKKERFPPKNGVTPKLPSEVAQCL